MKEAFRYGGAGEPAFPLAQRELGLGGGASERVGVCFGCVEPGPLGQLVFTGDVVDRDVAEPRAFNHLGAWPAGGDVPWPGADGSTVGSGVEVIGNVDSGERESSARSQHPTALT